MGFLNKFRKNAGEKNVQSDIPAEWKMDGIPAWEERPIENINQGPQPNLRQQRKIIACLASGENSALGRQDTNLDGINVEEIYGKIAAGEIGLPEKKAILKDIKAPKHKYRPESMLAGIMIRSDGRTEQIPSIGNDKHMRRIIAEVTGVGFANPGQVVASDVERFWNMYETPADFEHDSQALLNDIHRTNSPAKYNEYIASMRQFKQVMFGKQQEYWEQMQLIDQDAKRFSGQTDELDRPQAIAGEKEPVVKSVAVAELSRAQVSQGAENFEDLREDGSSQDKSLIMEEQGLFGVFDGVGGSEGGRLASSAAATEVQKRGLSDVMNSLDLCDILDAASAAINRTPGAGASTGTLAKIKEIDGQKMLMWASVGDSRIYIVSGNKAVQITKDEGYENKITNALGGGGGDESRARQAGTIYLNTGDRVVLCSDGITGDKGSDLMSAAELGDIVAEAKTANEAARNLTLRARKNDDRTAIVVQI